MDPDVDSELAALARTKPLTTKDLEKRLFIANELVSTEEAYVASLNDLITFFIIPIRSCSDTVLTDSEQALLFRNVETIALLHNKFLGDLRARQFQWDRGEVKGRRRSPAEKVVLYQ